MSIVKLNELETQNMFPKRLTYPFFNIFSVKYIEVTAI